MAVYLACGAALALLLRRHRASRSAPRRDARPVASSGDAVFDAAQAWFGVHYATLPTADQLHLYGLYKQASGAVCPASGPGLLEMERRAKWRSWREAARLSPGQAREAYVVRVDALAPAWRDASLDDAPAPPGRSRGMGPTQSTLAAPLEGDGDDDGADNDDPIFTSVEEGAVGAVKAWLDGGGDIALRRGWDGSTLLHCATDAMEDNVAMVAFLLGAGVAVGAQNADGATALLCATMNEHGGCVKALLAADADPAIRDNDGECAAEQETFAALSLA